MLLAPLFLLGLLGIGLPLWLHRFAKDTRTKEPFASLMLLEPSEIRQSREHTLRYFLLLALRIALLVLLVLAFTQPMLPWSTPPLEARDRTLHVIVLDTSLSMREGERWTRAVAKARSLIDALKSADQGMLVTADSRVRVVRGPVAQADADELRTALTSVRTSPARLDYGMLMTNAASWLGNDRPLTQFHFITDLQQTATPLQFADLEPPDGVRLILEDIAAPSTPNQYVKSVSIADHDANTLEVIVRGSPPPGVQRTVVLNVDGKEKAKKEISSPASSPGAQRGDPQGRNPETPSQSLGESRSATAVLPVSESRVLFNDLDLGTGLRRVTVSLQPGDSLAQDDQFFTVLERREPKALVIGANSNGDDVSYFSAAVGALTNPRLQVERTGSEALGQKALADYSALIVSDAGVLTGASAGSVQKYLEGGGAVLITLGPRAAQRDTMPVSAHTRDTRSPKAQGGSGANTGDVAGRVAAVEESHPALRDAQGWRSVRFFKYVPIETQPNDTVLIRFEDGHPLLVERRIGAGRLLVLTSPLDRDWSDLAIHPLFVRFIGEAARYLTSAAAAPNALIGNVLPIGVNGRNGAQVFDPNGNRVLALVDTTAQTRLLAEVPGFYEVRGGGRSDYIAVNPDPRESDLTHMSPASITQWTNLQRPERAPAATVQQANADAGPQLKALWAWLLLLAVTLALIEPLVANAYLHVRRGVAS